MIPFMHVSCYYYLISGLFSVEKNVPAVAKWLFSLHTQLARHAGLALGLQIPAFCTCALRFKYHNWSHLVINSTEFGEVKVKVSFHFDRQHASRRAMAHTELALSPPPAPTAPAPEPAPVISKSLRLVLLRLPWLESSGESTSRWSAKF